MTYLESWAGPGVQARWAALFTRRATATPSLYAWDLASGVGGVTDDRRRAFGHVNDELANAPRGTVATVRRVEPPIGDGRYLDRGTVATARRDEATGSVVWQ
ncbi:MULTISPECIES: hypothetical protein [Actinomadura]|uniref:Uncharacterized protein n=1 Tax=Actinomadura yumaensis TaxID=111807 RepID=A0ABW2CMK4_9ACTN|nr:hypothetical protein [Actinomadura sp. J1-007]MWK37813.1 hypothetical protein [Actinomadura sp. J1-007]